MWSGDRVAGSLVLLLAVVVFALTLNFPEPVGADPGVALLPRAVAVFLAVCALPLLLRPEPGLALPGGRAALRVGISGLLLLGYVAALEPLGFVLSTSVFLFAQGLILAPDRPLVLLVLTFAGSFALYYVFRELLGVPLPRSPWFGGVL